MLQHSSVFDHFGNLCIKLLSESEVYRKTSRPKTFKILNGQLQEENNL